MRSFQGRKSANIGLTSNPIWKPTSQAQPSGDSYNPHQLIPLLLGICSHRVSIDLSCCGDDGCHPSPSSEDKLRGQTHLSASTVIWVGLRDAGNRTRRRGFYRKIRDQSSQLIVCSNVCRGNSMVRGYMIVLGGSSRRDAHRRCPSILLLVLTTHKTLRRCVAHSPIGRDIGYVLQTRFQHRSKDPL